MYDRTEIEAIEKRWRRIGISWIRTRSRWPSRAKELANGFFKSGEYEKSVEQYTAAIAGARKDKTLWRNRAAARLQVGERLEGIHDSVKAVEVGRERREILVSIRHEFDGQSRVFEGCSSAEYGGKIDAREQRYRRTVSGGERDV